MSDKLKNWWNGSVVYTNHPVIHFGFCCIFRQYSPMEIKGFGDARDGIYDYVAIRVPLMRAIFWRLSLITFSQKGATLFALIGTVATCLALFQ